MDYHAYHFNYDNGYHSYPFKFQLRQGISRIPFQLRQGLSLIPFQLRQGLSLLTFQLRQGLSRRILVRVLPVGAGGNIACKSINSISIGNVHTQTRHQPALDSYQNEVSSVCYCKYISRSRNVGNSLL